MFKILLVTFSLFFLFLVNAKPSNIFAGNSLVFFAPNGRVNCNFAEDEFGEMIRGALEQEREGDLDLSLLTKAILEALENQNINQVVEENNPVALLYRTLFNFPHGMVLFEEDNPGSWEVLINVLLDNFKQHRPNEAEFIFRNLVQPKYQILNGLELLEQPEMPFETFYEEQVLSEFYSRLTGLNTQEEYENLLLDARYSASSDYNREFKYHVAVLRAIPFEVFKDAGIIQTLAHHQSIESYLHDLTLRAVDVVDAKVIEDIKMSLYSLGYDNAIDPSDYPQFIEECVQSERKYQFKVPDLLDFFQETLETLENEESIGLLRRIISTAKDTKLGRVLCMAYPYFAHEHEYEWDEAFYRSAAFIYFNLLKSLYPRETTENVVEGIDLEALGISAIYNKHFLTLKRSFESDREEFVGVFEGDFERALTHSGSLSILKLFRTEAFPEFPVNSKDIESGLILAAMDDLPALANYIIQTFPVTFDVSCEIIEKVLNYAIDNISLRFIEFFLLSATMPSEHFTPQILSKLLNFCIKRRETHLAQAIYRKFPLMPDSVFDFILEPNSLRFRDRAGLYEALQIILLKPNLSGRWVKAAARSLKEPMAVTFFRKQRPELWK